MPAIRISRRDALRLTLGAGAATAAPHPGHAAPPAWQQAPGLAQASKQGKLPDVGQRLPTHPEVVQPTAGAPDDMAGSCAPPCAPRRCRPQRDPAHYRQHGPLFSSLVSGLRQAGPQRGRKLVHQRRRLGLHLQAAAGDAMVRRASLHRR